MIDSPQPESFLVGSSKSPIKLSLRTLLTAGQEFRAANHLQSFCAQRVSMTRLRIILFACAVLSTSTLLSQQAPKTPQTSKLIEQLQSSDPTARGAAKLELMRSANPDALPALLKLASTSKGDLRTNLLEILGAYKDPRKIPTLIQMSRPFESEYVYSPLHRQLVELGTLAAQPLMDSIPDECGGNDWEPAGYSSWVASLLDEIGTPAMPAIFSGLRSGKPCKQSSGAEALLRAYLRPNIGPPLEPAEEIERDEAALLTDAAQDSDPNISNTAYQWIDSAKAANFAQLDYARFVEALIGTYQSNASPETMVEIANLLAKVSSPRVARFMRAAVRAPNPEIQKIATAYVTEHAPPPKPTATRAPARTSEQKIHLAEELARSYDSSETPKLARLLSDADPKVRAAAAENLGELNMAPSDSRDERERDIEHSIPPLVKALNDSSPEVRAAAAKAIGEIKELHGENGEDDPQLPEISAKLVSLLKDSDPMVVTCAARALGQIQALATVPELIPLMKHQNHYVRYAAVEAIARMPGPSVTCPLLSATEDEDREIRSVAAGPLYGKFENGERCPGDVETLMAAAKDPATQFGALQALGKLKDPAAVEPLIAQIRSFTTRSVCPECPVLAKIGDKRAVAPMVSLIRNRNGDVGTEVVYALGELQDPSAVPAILPLLKDARPQMRVAAIKALGALGSCQTMADVRASLSDEVAEVRAAAADNAGACKDAQSVDLLIRMLSTNMLAAAKALGDIGDKRAVDPLMAVFHQHSPLGLLGDRPAVAHALGQLHDARAVDLLIAGLHDNEIARESAQALGEIGDARAVPPLQQVVRETPAYGAFQVADAATAALKKMNAPVPARQGKT